MQVFYALKGRNRRDPRLPCPYRIRGIGRAVCKSAE